MDNSGYPAANGLYWMVITADTAAGTSATRSRSGHALQGHCQQVDRHAGTKITWTVNTAETQTGWVKLSVKQPGLAKYSVIATV